MRRFSSIYYRQTAIPLSRCRPRTNQSIIITNVLFAPSMRSLHVTSERDRICPLLENVKSANVSDMVLHSTAGGAARDATPAFIDATTGQVITFADNYNYTLQLRDIYVRQFDIQPGDVVLIFSPNSVFYAALWHAAVSVGAVASTVNMTATASDLHRQVVIGRAKLIVTVPELVDVASESLRRLCNDDADDCSLFVFDPVESLLAPEKTVGDIATRLDTSPGGDELCALPFSSGTTGLPKGVQLTHFNICSNIIQVGLADGISVGHVAMAVLPYFHIYGLTVVMNLALYAGATQVVFRRFDLELYLQCIEKYGATHLYIAPPIAIALAKSPLTLKYRRDSVIKIKSGAAPLGTAVQSEVIERFPNAHVRQGYGLTEVSPVSHFQPEWSRTTGSIGTLLANTEAKIMCPTTEQPVSKSGEEGELWLRGPQVMKGYLRQEDTDVVMRPGGWFRTGDLAKVDETGHFYITDRLKELIKVKGYQVAPAELEAVLLGHPAVQDAVVVGVAHDTHGEVPKAHVHLKSGHTESTQLKEEIMAYVLKQVSPYKKLHGVRFVDCIPKTPSGKLLRRVSREMETELSKKQ